MICIVYSRVSTEDQAKHGYSLPDQREKGDAAARGLGYAEPQIVQLWDDVTGDLMDERPGLAKARELIRAGGVGHFICFDPDRFSRKAAHAMLLLEEIEKAGVTVVFINSDYQNTLDGKLFFGMRALIAEFEKGKILMRTSAARLTKAKEGKIPQFASCFGFHYDKETDELSIVQEQASVYRLMVAWLLSGWSYDRIVKQLNLMGVRTARGNAFMQPGVRRIMANPIYKGEYVVRKMNTIGTRHNKRRPKEERIRATLRPVEENIIIQVPAIIDAETWAAVQEERANRRRMRPGKAIEFYMLSGLLRCGICGHPMAGLRAAWSKNEPGKRVRYYVCGAKAGRYKGNPTCLMRYWRADKLEAEVWAEVVKWMTDPEAWAASQEEAAGDADQLALAERQMAELQAERSRLVDLYVRDLLPKADADRRLGEMKKREEHLSRRLAELKPARRTMKPVDVAAALEGFSDELSTATREDKKRYCQMLIEWIRVMPDGNHQIRGRNPDAVLRRLQA